MILSWKRGAEQLFGFTPEEAVGRPVTIIVPLDRLEEEARDPREESLRRADRALRTVWQREDGSLVDISLTVSPIRNSRGKTVSASKIARGITDLRKGPEIMPGRMDFVCRRFHSLSSRYGAMVVTCSWALRPLRVTPPMFDR